MKRRDVLKSILVAAAAARIQDVYPEELMMRTNSRRTLATRPYKDGIHLSLIGFGGILLMGESRKRCGKMVAHAFERGVNYFDVAPSYGDGEAEEKLGPALEPYRQRVFLACKTMQRNATGALKELEHSLKQMRTDHFDLYQFHAVTTLDEVDQITRAGGALELFLKAREQGKVRYLGFSAHSEQAALAMMDRFSFDSILFPINYVCYARGNFGPSVMTRAKETGVVRLALKALAHTPWAHGAEHTYPKCWYRPIDDPALAGLALRFTLSEEVTAALPPGEERLFRLALEIASNFTPLSAQERADLLRSAGSLEALFKT